MNEPQNNIIGEIIQTITNSNNGTVFFSNSFPTYDDEYVGHILSDLVKNGVLYRIGRGIYLKSKKTKFGLVYPTLEDMANAIARRDNAEILPTGATALNMLGLSTQIPMNPTFLTTGSARIVNLSGRTITFKHAAPRNFAIQGKVRRIMVQALKAIGEKNMTENDYANFVALINKFPELETIENDLKYMSMWMRKLFHKALNTQKFTV